MKLRFNIGYNFQSAIFLDAAETDRHSSLFNSAHYNKISEFNAYYKKQERYPNRNQRELRLFFMSIKRL